MHLPFPNGAQKYRNFGLFLVMINAVIIGFVQVTQSGINISLTRWTRHPLRSAFIQFSIAGMVLFPLFILCKAKNVENQYETNSLSTTFDNLTVALKENKKNYFVFANGLCGIIWICAAIYIAPQIGFGLYAICIVIGQILSSMFIDHFGLVWSVKKKLSCLNIFGCIIAIIGVIIFQIQPIINNNNNNNELNILLLFVYVIISIFAGTCFTLLSAFNRRIKTMIDGTPYQAGFILFVNAIILTLIMNIILYIVQDDWFVVNNEHFVWYMFFGGVGAAFVVSMYIICLSYIGFVTTYICSIFGSLVISLLYDVIGAFGVDVTDSTISVLKIIGVICVLVGAIIMNIKRSDHEANNDTQIIVHGTELNGLDETDETENILLDGEL